MATTKEMLVNGVMTQITEFDHSAQEIDDGVERALPGGEIDTTVSQIAERMSGENLLHNWYFADPINQRGQTEYSGTAYAIDRWKVPGGHTLAIVDGGIKLTCNSSGSMNLALQQFAELGAIQEGDTVTASVLIVANTTVQTTGIRVGNSLKENIPAGATGLYTATFAYTSSSSENYIGLQFNDRVNDNGNYFVVAAMKLERGSVQTLAHQDADGNWVLNDPPPDKATELAKCQRYFVNFNPNKMEWFAMPPAVSSSTTLAYSCITLPVAMRAEPVVSYGGTIFLSQTGNITVTGIEVSGGTFTGISIQLKYLADGLTAQSLYRAQGGQDTTSYIWLSADL